jgi:hypothetical protein
MKHIVSKRARAYIKSMGHREAVPFEKMFPQVGHGHVPAAWHHVYRRNDTRVLSRVVRAHRHYMPGQLDGCRPPAQDTGVRSCQAHHR